LKELLQPYTGTRSLVLDGQQRLTSLQLLCCAVTAYYLDIQPLIDVSIFETPCYLAPNRKAVPREGVFERRAEQLLLSPPLL